jgi:peptide/nickel transport system substrate-binding protein
MRWSDGEQVTTADVDFWWNDVLRDTEITSQVPWYYRLGGEPMELEIIDDYTFKVTHAVSFGNFPTYLTRHIQDEFGLMPSHYAANTDSHLRCRL